MFQCVSYWNRSRTQAEPSTAKAPFCLLLFVIEAEQGKPYTVRYDAVNAMLLNEFLKEHRKVTEQETKLPNSKQPLRN